MSPAETKRPSAEHPNSLADPSSSAKASPTQCLEFPGTDLQVRVHLEGDALIVEVAKSNALVYRVVVEQATGALEHAWIVDLFMRSDRVRLGELSAEVADYLGSLDIAQG